jgi:ribokinase
MIEPKKRRKSRFSVVSLGDLVVDLVFEIPRLPVIPGEVQVARGPTLEPGGAGNTLIAGARLGLQMLALGSLGDDTYGRQTAEILVSEGVDITAVVHAPGSSSTLVLVLVDEAGEHAFLGAYGTGPKLPLSDLWRERITAADAFFTNAYALSEPQLRNVMPQAVTSARQAGVPVFVDVGPDISSVPMDVRQSIYGQSTVIVGTEEEMLVATEMAEAEAAAAALLDHAHEMVVVKRGEKGCWVYTKDHMLDLPAFPVPLRDSTAAGDTFDAAIMYAYLNGYSAHDVGVFANAVAAAKVQKVGSGRQVPTAVEVVEVLLAYGVDLPFTGHWSGARP